ncbi:MAG: hypothetical protein ACE5PV_23310 [Candidatus Poribacteria bacterium]
MKEIIIYVEGPSDKYGMEALLRRVIQMSSQKGTLITFVPIKGARGQQGKEPLLNEGTKKAANILINKPSSWVFIVPDLYPLFYFLQSHLSSQNLQTPQTIDSSGEFVFARQCVVAYGAVTQDV